MRKPILIFFSLLIIFLIILTVAHAGPPAEGGTLPDIILSVPQDVQQQQYLGVTDKTVFEIPQIKSEIVIIEIFSMY